MFLKLGFALGFSTTDTLMKNYKQNQEDYFKLQMTTTAVVVIWTKKVEVSRCSLMDFELSSKRPGQRKFLCWTGWGIDCWYRSKTCKKKVSKKLIPWMLRLRIAMANNQSVRFNKGTQILEMKFAY